MEVTLYGGVEEVGGNKILLRDRETRIFLDFGMSFAQKKRYFGEYLNPRVANGLGDLLEMGLLPDIEGLYRKDLLEMMGRVHKDPEYLAIFLTHAHLDHCSYVSFVDETIPIYCGETTKRYLDAVQESSNRNFEQEILNYIPRPNMGYEPIEREFVVFKSEFGSDHISIDDMEIAPIPVDHSIKGACGFFVYAPDLTLSYTGDLKPGENTREFIEKCKNERIDALITEGTRLEKGNEREVDKLHTEEEVKANCKTIVEKSDGMVFADFSFKDLDRVRTFYQIAKETERKFVISPGDACILYHLDKNLLDDENVVVYKGKKKTGTYANNDYYQWERAYLDKVKVNKDPWTARDVKNNQGRVIMTLNYYKAKELIDIKPENGIYIHSRSLPFDEESTIDYQKLQNWLDHFDLIQYHYHSSGHLSRDQLKDALERIKPKKVIPIHSGNPSGFKDICPASELVLPGVGETIKLF